MAKYKQYKLSPWCKTAKIAMIQKDISIEDIANKLGYCRPHVSAVLNGRIISDNTIDKISEYLGISNEHG